MRIYIAIIYRRNKPLHEQLIEAFGSIVEAQRWVDRQLADMDNREIGQWDIITRSLT